MSDLKIIVKDKNGNVLTDEDLKKIYIENEQYYRIIEDDEYFYQEKDKKEET